METPGSIVGLGARTDYLGTVPVPDVTRLGLSGEEALVLAVVGRASTIQDIIGRSGFPEPKAIALLLGLRAKGAIAPARVSRSAPSVVDAAMCEEVDLPPERKQEILAMERMLDTANHYEVLDIEPGAGDDEIRRAYHEVSRRFHPDRYFSKNLGSFRARLERIFRRATEAHGVLSDPERRSAYLRAHPEILAGADGGLLGDPGPARVEDPVRAAERKQRLARHPYLARSRQAHDLMAEAKRLMEQGELSRAVAQLNHASRMDPRNREIPALLQEARRKSESDRARRELERADQLERAGDWAGAAAQYRTAATVDPKNAVAAARAAALMLRTGEDLKEAKGFALRAVDLQPRNADTRVLLAKVLLAAEMKKLARRELEEALRCDPEHAEAKALLKKVKWTF